MTSEGVHIKVPATSANLGPGFDALGLALGLHLELWVSQAEAGITIVAEGEGARDIPLDASNVIIRAMASCYAQVGLTLPPLHVRMQNAIPLTRGLGSSAAAIVAGLVAANALLGYPLDKAALLTLASTFEGHPDNVTPALLGGMTVACRDGRHVHWLRFAPPPHWQAVVAVPDRPLPTRLARQVVPQAVPLTDAVFNLQRATLLVAAFAQGDATLLETAMQDRWHQPYRAALVPGLEAALAAARSAGAFGAALSGAGPAVMALVSPKLADAVGRAMEDAFQTAGVAAQSLTLPLDAEGASAEPWMAD